MATSRKLLLILGILILIGLSAVGGYEYGVKNYTSFIDSMHLVREDDSSSFFVHPILGLSLPDAINVNEFQPLVTQVKKIFSMQSNVVGRYSVYFRDLNKGLWFGINENDTYDPASMLKVALAFAAYKQAESDPGFLEHEVVYTQALANINTSIQYADPTKLQVGASYTVSDLLKKMIVDSDNGAKDALGNSIDPSIQNKVYTDLGMTIPQDGTAYSISPQQYSVFFRRLFNGNYLTKQSSNELLQLLSEATFKDGLVAGVATSTPVSHKYGEHINSADNTITSTELHDCGIIYQPNDPYLLCIMTEGKDESDLASVISSVSKAVNQEVAGGYK